MSRIEPYTVNSPRILLSSGYPPGMPGFHLTGVVPTSMKSTSSWRCGQCFTSDLTCAKYFPLNTWCQQIELLLTFFMSAAAWDGAGRLRCRCSLKPAVGPPPPLVQIIKTVHITLTIRVQPFLYQIPRPKARHPSLHAGRHGW